MDPVADRSLILGFSLGCLLLAVGDFLLLEKPLPREDPAQVFVHLLFHELALFIRFEALCVFSDEVVVGADVLFPLCWLLRFLELLEVVEEGLNVVNVLVTDGKVVFRTLAHQLRVSQL